MHQMNVNSNQSEWMNEWKDIHSLWLKSQKKETNNCLSQVFIQMTSLLNEKLRDSIHLTRQEEIVV